MENYNGWTNYNTWKVSTELMDYDYWNDVQEENSYTTEFLALQIEADIYEQALYDVNPVNSFAISAIEDFLSDVNWEEIASMVK